MKIVSQTSKSYLCRIPGDEYYLISFLLRSLHEHLQYDEDCEVWSDDGGLIVAIEDEDKSKFDSIISNL